MRAIASRLLLAVLTMSGLSSAEGESDRQSVTGPLPWRGQHLHCDSAEGADTLVRLIEDYLGPMGINVLVVEVNYGFQFQSHPEISQGSLDRAAARRIAAACKAQGIRVIPLLNCLGHQSWGENTYALLREHPEFDETPHIPLNNPDIYCRSWCPSHPDVNQLVFDLMDELIDGFEARALHVGMDEVFLIASDQCPRCRGKSPAELFAKAVNDFHDHLVKQKGVEMLMWGDRLIDAQQMSYGPWEASANGTAPAVDMIPRDVIICDWHYEPRTDYPSVKFFQDKGFRVLVAPSTNIAATEALISCALSVRTDKLLGVLFTGWGTGPGGSRLLRGLRGELGPEERGYDEARVLRRFLPMCQGGAPLL